MRTSAPRQPVRTDRASDLGKRRGRSNKPSRRPTAAVERVQSEPAAQTEGLLQGSLLDRLLGSTLSRATTVGSANAPLEREADRAAAAVLNAERLELGRASDAGASAQPIDVETRQQLAQLSGRGQALSASERSLFEPAFGVDLRNVRIHRSSLASEVAESIGALAFNIGADIVLGAAAPSFGTHAGQQLLAHELAHVVQRATGRVGVGTVLRQTPSQPKKDEAHEKKAKPTVEELRKQELDSVKVMGQLFALHKTRSANTDPSLQAALDAIGEVVDAQPASTPLIAFDKAKNPVGNAIEKWLIDDQLPKNHKLTAISRSFLIDALKIQGPSYWPTVLTVLDKDAAQELNTVKVDVFSDWLATQRTDIGWYLDAFAAHPRTRKFWADQFVTTYVGLLFNPFNNTAVPLYGDDVAGNRSWKVHKQALEDGAKANELIGTERLHLALRTVDDLDQKREKDQTSKLARAREGSKGMTPASKRQFLAELIASDFKIRLETPVHARIKAIDERVLKVANEAVRFWTAAVAVERDVLALRNLGANKLLATGAGSKLHGNIETDDYLKSFGNFLATQATELFARQTSAGQPLPAPVDYASKFKRFRDALVGDPPGLGGYVQKIEGEIYKLTTGKVVGQVPTSYAFILAWLSWLHPELPKYDTAKETVKDADGPRAAHRWNVAKLLLEFALFAGLDKLAAVTLPIVGGEGLPSRVALIGDWHEDPSTPSRLIQDFPDNLRFSPYKGGGKYDPEIRLAVGQVVDLFRAGYLDTLSGLLEKVVADKVAQGQLTHRDTVALQPTVDAMKKYPRPARYKVDSFVYIFNADDLKNASDSDGKIDYSKLPEAAPMLDGDAKTRTQLPTPEVGGFRLFPRRNFAEAFAWVVPSIEPLIVLLRNEPGKTDNLQWFQNFIETSTDDAIEQAIAGLVSKTGERTTKAFRALNSVFRRITIKRVEHHLDQWGGDMHKSGFLTKAMRELIDYRANVTPALDEEWQVGALMLGLATKLDSAFPDDKYKEIPAHLKSFLEIGLAMSDGSAEHTAGLEAVCDKVPYGGDSAATLIAQRPALKRVADRLGKANSELQERFGFHVAGNSISSMLYATTLEVGEEFTYDQALYQILAVHRSFAYYEPMPASQVASALKESVGGGPLQRSSEKLLTVRIIRPEGKGNFLPGAMSDIARKITVSKESKSAAADDGYQPPALQEGELGASSDSWDLEVTAADDGLLDQLSKAITNRTMMKGLENLGTATQVFGELTMTAAETFLPGGQAAGAARLALQIAQAIDNADFKAFLDKLLDDPKELVAELEHQLLAAMKPDALWSFVFFGHPLIDHLSALAPKQQRKTTIAATGKLGKVFRFVTNLGKRMLNAYRAMKRSFQGPTAALHSTIMTRPAVNWILLEIMRLAQLAIEHASDLASLGEDVVGQIKSFRDQAAEFVRTLEELELPNELIPTKVMTEFVVDFAIGLIPKVKVLRPLLDKAGITPLIAAEVAKVLDKLGFNESAMNVPNELYRTKVRDMIVRELGTVRTQFVGDLRAILNDGIAVLNKEFSLGLAPLAPAEADSAKLKLAYKSTEELELSRSNAQPSGEQVALPTGSGEPLPRSVLDAAEVHFGEDFGHVRLHSDSAAERFTEALGANAATSGSHVFLRRGLSPTSTDGVQIVRHELAHVIQQTGSRPLGLDHAPDPIRGDRSLGLQWDPAREAAADRAAASTRTAAASRATARGSRAGTVEANFRSDTLPRIFKKMLTFRPAGTYIGVEESDNKGLADAYTIWKLVREQLQKKDPKNFAAMFHSPKTVCNTVVSLVTEVDEKHGDVGGVAALAQRRDPGKKTKHLVIKRFVTLLEGWIFAKTGVALQIDLASEKSPFKISKLKVGYVHVGFITELKGKPIWDQLLKTDGLFPESWKTVRPDWNDRTKLIAELRARVRSSDSLEAFMFTQDKASGAIRFSRSFIKDLQKSREIEAAAKDSKDNYPDDIDPAVDYVKPSGANGRGLRIDTHGELKKLDGRGGRDSHHLTQFVLLEYLRERKGVKPFPKLNAASETALGITRNPFINLLDLSPHGKFDLYSLDPTDTNSDDFRGDGMPALMLARETHHRGNLHVPGEQRDDGSDGPKTQGTAVHNHFTGALAGTPLEDRKPKVWNDFILKKPDEAKQHISNAIKATYAWMYYSIMQPPILPALEKHEVRYYIGIAARKDPERLRADGRPKVAWDIRPYLSKVAIEAEKFNVDTMRVAGFTK